MMIRRAHFIGAPEFFHLNVVCQVINHTFGDDGYGCYLVGSSLYRRDYRDVDVRYMMADEHYDRLFPNPTKNQSLNAFWTLTCAAISEWMSKRTGLPIDFQIQKMSDANAEYPGKEIDPTTGRKVHERNHLGLFMGREK